MNKKILFLATMVIMCQFQNLDFAQNETDYKTKAIKKTKKNRSNRGHRINKNHGFPSWRRNGHRNRKGGLLRGKRYGQRKLFNLFGLNIPIPGTGGINIPAIPGLDLGNLLGSVLGRALHININQLRGLNADKLASMGCAAALKLIEAKLRRRLSVPGFNICQIVQFIIKLLRKLK